MNKWTSVGFSYFRRIDRVGPAMRNVYNLCDEGLLTLLRHEPCSPLWLGEPESFSNYWEISSLHPWTLRIDYGNQV